MCMVIGLGAVLFFFLSLSPVGSLAARCCINVGRRASTSKLRYILSLCIYLLIKVCWMR